VLTSNVLRLSGITTRVRVQIRDLNSDRVFRVPAAENGNNNYQQSTVVCLTESSDALTTNVMCTNTVITIVALVCAAVAVRPIAGSADRLVTAQGESDELSSYRLPRDTQPFAYGLRLVPRYDIGSGSYTFVGQVEISIYVNSITPNVTLNAKDMQINSVAITEFTTQRDLEVDSYELDNDAEILTIYVASNLLVDRRYQVKIIFQGLLRTDMTGFYKSVYKEDGVDK